MPGYATLAECGFDGAYVSPIQMSSGSADGPLLMSKDWLDAPTARAAPAPLRDIGYLPSMPFNKVLDAALNMAGLRRGDIYIAPVFCLLPPVRSHALPLGDALASFDAVTRHEILGRRPIALGRDAAAVLSRRGVDHIAIPHPSARGRAFADRAALIADALRRVARS
nr:hypothetical protein [Hasllibacter sp. MH4015]